MAQPDDLDAALRELARMHGVTVAQLLEHRRPSDPLTVEKHRAHLGLIQRDPDLHLKLLNPSALLVLFIVRNWPGEPLR